VIIPQYAAVGSANNILKYDSVYIKIYIETIIPKNVQNAPVKENPLKEFLFFNVARIIGYDATRNKEFVIKNKISNVFIIYSSYKNKIREFQFSE